MFNPVTILILINVVVYFIPYLFSFGYNQEQSFQNFLALGWKSNELIRDGEYYRLLSSTFLHGSLTHLFLNMFSLYQVGPAVLSYFKTPGFLAIYLLSGLGGSVLSYIYNPGPSVGASGAIFGLVGALVSLSVLTNSYGMLNNLILVIVLNFAFSFSPNSGIDNFGHIGGLLTGIFVGGVLLKLNPGILN